MILYAYVFVSLILTYCSALECDKAGEKCTDYSEGNCERCIQSHPCCNWCYAKDFDSSKRCNTKEKLLKLSCNSSSIFVGGNSNIASRDIINATFMDPDERIQKPATQIRPQHLKLQLRLREPITFRLQYKAAKDYPLDLYYLMDLTYSMRHDVKTMVDLGNRLAQFLQNLSKTYKIAFGYYSDKVEMPFSFMAANFLQNPCAIVNGHCEKGFDFMHTLNFTQSVADFIKKVNSSRTTANIDDLEGGSDAIMQIVSCKNYMKWRKYSRKIIVIATDGYLHFAGDGILAGVTKRNPGLCLLDINGTYSTKSLEFDYPSLEEIHKKLLQNKVNLLFAAKKEVYNYYQELHKLISEVSYVGKLANQSDNILDLVRESYTKVVRSVGFDTNATDEVKVTFKSSCNKEQYRNQLYEKNSCDNIEIGEVYNFDVTFELQKLPSKGSDRIVIGERNIAEDVIVDVEYIGIRCECESGTAKRMINRCNHGVFECGKCNCETGWTGEHCTIECVNNIQSCRFRNETYTSTTCYGHGECDLSACACDCDSNYMGKYCEYNQCPRNRKTNEVCSGNQGTCVKGICHCEKGFIDMDCGCIVSNETCIVPGQDEVCNGKGSCECGRCICPEGYSGNLCEYCANCTSICNTYSECILATVNRKLQDKCPTSYKTNQVSQLDDANCLERYYRDEQLCEIKFSYTFKKSYVLLDYSELPCFKPVPATAVVATIIAAIIAVGAITLIVWKVKVTRQDKIEWEKFENNIKSNTWHSGENPIYNSPIRKYFNPLNEIEMQDADKKLP